MHPANRWLLAAITPVLLTSVSLWEGTRYYAYHDIVGVPTVCQGYTGPGIIFGRKYSAEECKTFLIKEIKTHAEGMLNCVKVPLTQNQFNAFTLFTYNVGVNAFCNASLTKKLNNGDIVGACNGLMAWVYADGYVVKGLQNRREFEREMCLRDVR